MVKRIIVLVIIFVCTSIIWIILGSVNLLRTSQASNKLSKQVETLWGDCLIEKQPEFYMVWEIEESYQEKDQYNRIRIITKKKEKKEPIIPEKSDIKCDINLEYRKRGLKWFSVYTCLYKAFYMIKPSKINIEKIRILYNFPSQKSIFDDFKLIINEEEIKNLNFTKGEYGNSTEIINDIPYNQQENFKIEISYVSRGLNFWKYSFGNSVNQIKDFNLDVKTNFKKIDYAQDCISPTAKTKLKNGWKLTWKYSNLLSGYNLGIKMPQKLNPGEIASRISFFAPISLLFFFIFLFFITIIMNKQLHPMHYFFLAASFLSFHLFFSYTVDHFNIYLCFIMASIISVFLVAFYLSIIHGIKFTIFFASIPQFIYLVIFTFSHFFEGYTGLTVTLASIATLFILMKLTATIDWEKKFLK
ncbi:MAG: inner membrane CreD family protein [Spirochaetes bacterium]|nr:inner membrane CreD family protein [Spirochaetota bacterium]